LFSQQLEKGVILRARVRGTWLPADRDESLAAASYRNFAALDPPLTT
jgi:hypothetical protein